jgi:tyrosyl-tRNA synthetase
MSEFYCDPEIYQIINNKKEEKEGLTIEERIEIISSIGEEIIDVEGLVKLLINVETYNKNHPENKKDIIAYDGFEPSGRMHIAQGLLRAHNVNKFVKAGVKFKFWVADWFALMNLKLGGDLKKIQKAGTDMIDVWKACGMNTEAVDEDGKPMIEFIWSSEEINKRSDEYWKLVLDIGTKFNLNRIKKCTQIMGREESDELAASQIFYPVMQCADIFFLKADICSLGLDQRKVNMLAIEYCDKIKRKHKPIIISHHMIMGLDGSDKMSKSNPDNTIFMDDKPNDVKRKITQAFCEPGNVEKNPLLDWAKHIIFPIVGHFTIPANEKWNEPEQKYGNFECLELDFAQQKIHPKGIKEGMIKHINNLLTSIQTKINMKN